MSHAGSYLLMFPKTTHILKCLREDLFCMAFTLSFSQISQEMKVAIYLLCLLIPSADLLYSLLKKKTVTKDKAQCLLNLLYTKISPVVSLPIAHKSRISSFTLVVK